MDAVGLVALLVKKQQKTTTKNLVLWLFYFVNFCRRSRPLYFFKVTKHERLRVILQTFSLFIPY